MFGNVSREMNLKHIYFSEMLLNLIQAKMKMALLHIGVYISYAKHCQL